VVLSAASRGEKLLLPCKRTGIKARGPRDQWLLLFSLGENQLLVEFFLLRAHNRLPEDFFSITDCTRKCTRLQIFLLGLLKILPRFL
jgi:hypothetical protein